MNIGPTIINISTALLMYVINQLSAPPVTLPCEGKVQLNGSYVFELQPSITDLLNDPYCEVQLIIENTVRAIYEEGNVPANLSSPVLKATMLNFTLSYCPNSVTLDVDCPFRQEVLRRENCQCVYSAPVQPIGPSPLTRVSKANKTNSVVTGVAIGLSLVGVTAIAIAWFIIKHRKKMNKNNRMKKNNRSTSASSSADDPGVANMMLRHDDQA